MNFPFYIAKRYLFSKKSHNAINVISAISVCGVALATLAMVCTLSVFNGFQDVVATFFTAFDPELKITATTGKVFDGQDERILELKKLPEVAVFSESLEENAMVQYKGRQTMAVIKGVEDNFDRLTPITRRLIIRPATDTLRGSVSSSLNSAFISVENALVTYSAAGYGSMPIARISFRLFRLIISCSLSSNTFILLKH